jgi:hypothetical protein
MRSLSLTLILIPLLLLGAGCKRRHRSSSQTQMPVSTVFAGDPNVAAYFAKGFYQVEENAWRWTAKDFSVDLAPPLHAEQKGAQLVVKLAIADPVIQKSGSVQLSAEIQGYKLDPQTYTKPGQYTYTRDVPPDKLQGPTVQIDFSVDHTLPPAGNDIRELGIIVSQVGLMAK